MSTAVYDRTAQDVGNMLAMEHINLGVPDQSIATRFYIAGLGFTRDPYMMVGLENMWVNAGRQQFHLPTSERAQQVRGVISLVVPSLDHLRARLTAVGPALTKTSFDCVDMGAHLDVTGPWGNRFRCSESAGKPGSLRIGVASVEFHVPEGAAAGIARFYTQMMQTPASVTAEDGATTAIVHAGQSQTLRFREDAAETHPYDGHHIAVYITNFSGPHDSLESRGLITEETNDFQYRFVRIVEPDTGELLYELEHEVRSFTHPMFQRPLVNRDPGNVLADYVRGADALTIG